MATTVFENEKYSLTKFWGGVERGQCIQLTIGDGKEWIELTRDEAIELAIQLLRWAKESIEEERKQIEKHSKELGMLLRGMEELFIGLDTFEEIFLKNEGDKC